MTEILTTPPSVWRRAILVALAAFALGIVLGTRGKGDTLPTGWHPVPTEAAVVEAGYTAGAFAQPIAPSKSASPQAPQPNPPARDFALPPTDAPPPPVVPPPPSGAPVAPAPAPPPAPAPAPPPPPLPVAAPLGKARVLVESEGVPVIIGNSGTITFGATAQAAPAPAAAPAPSPQADPRPAADPAGAIGLLVTAAEASPQIQTLTAAVAKRLAGGISYTLTGRCPGAAPRAPTLVPASYVQPIAYDPRPVAPPPVSYVPVYAAPQPAPAPRYYLAPPPAAASPQYAIEPAPARKCRLFGH